MRILIIRSNESGLSYETNITGIYPPLGLAYIASVLRNAGYAVNFLDNRILRLRKDSLKKEIKKARPDTVLLSAMTPSWPGVIELSKIIKEVSGQIIVGVGGPHLSVYPVESLSASSFDFGVYGEGEETLLKVLQNIQNGRSLGSVLGCVFKENGSVVVNPPRKAIGNLDKLPFPAVDLLPIAEYFALSLRRPLFSMITSRGCPYSCNFCFQGYLGKYRCRSAQNVVEEMEMLVNKYKIREIVVFDETFAVEKERAMEICELIRKKDLKFKWDIRTRVGLLDREILSSLKGAGCRRLHLGIESGSQAVLDRMEKGLSILETSEKVNLAKSLGFELRGYFMLGYPDESRGDIRDTIEFAKSLPLDWASFTVTIGLPHTRIYEEALESGYFSIDYWKEYTKGRVLDSRPYFIPDGCSERDLLALKKKAYLEFYSRPKIAWNIIRNARIIDGVGNLRNFLHLLPSTYRSIAKM